MSRRALPAALACATLASAPAPAAAEADAPPALEAAAAITHFRSPSPNRWTVTIAELSAAARVDDAAWLTVWTGAIHGAEAGFEANRLANLVIGVRVASAFRTFDLELGGEVALPVARVEVAEGGVRDFTQVRTYLGAAYAHGMLDRWRWMPGWTAAVLPVRISTRRGDTTLGLHAAAALAYSTGGESRDPAGTWLAQLAFDVDHRMTPWWRIRARFGAMALRPRHDLDGDGELDHEFDRGVDGGGIVELGTAVELGAATLHVRAGLPFGDPEDDGELGLALTAAAEWRMR